MKSQILGTRHGSFHRMGWTCNATLNSGGELRRHHQFSVDLAAINNESPIANGMNHALLTASCVDARGNRLLYEYIMLRDEIYHFALDVGDALPD